MQPSNIAPRRQEEDEEEGKEEDNNVTAENDEEEKVEEDEEDEEDEVALDEADVQALLRKLTVEDDTAEPPAPLTPQLSSFDLAGVAEKIKTGMVKNIIVMAGAGISVAAGIPDFRTPGSGLYSNLQKYNLPTAESVFDIDFFRDTPEPFYQLAGELFPGRYRPTTAHCFMRLLHEKGLLLRLYSQNIDSLEALAGIPPEKVVAAHGNFDGAHCIGEKRHDCPVSVVRAAANAAAAGGGAAQPPRCATCGELVKPSIVFFGEQLPKRFWALSEADFPQCDLLIVMGTSLVVKPFASLVGAVGETVPRLLINRVKVGELDPSLAAIMGPAFANPAKFNFANAHRDAFHGGDCDGGARALAELMGWAAELEAIVQEVGAAFDAQTAALAGGGTAAA